MKGVRRLFIGFFLLLFIEGNAQDSIVKPRVFNLSMEMTDVKNQGDRASCASFATLALVEYEIKKHYGLSYNLSEQYLNYLVQSYPTNNRTEECTLIDCASVVVSTGMLQEADWPYRNTYFGKGYPCEAYKIGNPRTPVSCYQHAALPEEIREKQFNLKIDVRAINPKYVKSTTDALFFKSSPIAFLYPLDEKNWEGENGSILASNAEAYHIAVISGYDLDKEVYFVKNSWGEEWGSGGYGTVSFENMALYAYKVGMQLEIINPDSLLLPEARNLPKVVLSNFEVITKYQSNKTITLDFKGVLTNIGHSTIEIMSSFWALPYSEDNPKNIDSLVAMATPLELTEAETKKFKGHYLLERKIYQSNSTAIEKLDLGEFNAKNVFSKPLLACESLRAALKDENMQILLVNSIYHFNDIEAQGLLGRKVEIVDKNWLKN